MSITDKLNNVIEKYNITRTNNIIYGTNIPMPNMVIPTPWKTYIRFDESEYYFFYFDEDGITIYSINGESYANILWEQVEGFKISHVFILGKMTIKTSSATYKFQINRFVFGCPWITQNTKYLEDNNYFRSNKVIDIKK